MSRRAGAIPLSILAGALILAACTELPSGANDLLSFEFRPLPSPSVVVGDTLRDSLGVATPIRIAAFNYDGDSVATPSVVFKALDRGIRVDSLTGIIVGDSVRPVARVLASLKGFDGTVSIGVTYRPDTAVAVNARDSVLYSLTDSTANVSAAIGLKLLHGPAGSDTAVVSYPVSFRITSPSTAGLARLVGENNVTSSRDTTDTSGNATRRVRIDPSKLTSLNDSVIVEAIAKYRGANVKGSPVKLVLKLKVK